MQQTIYDTNDEFDFNKIRFSKPINVSAGVFMLKFAVGDIPLYINPPKCTMKISAKGVKRTHCDFVFSQENDQFIRWIENLEKVAQDKIYENRNQWFETELEKEDIESYFTSSLKIYKSGKCYLLKTNLPSAQQQQKQSFKIYDEDENEIQFDAITDSMQIMCVLEVQGVKCSSSNFQIELLVKQMMVLRPVDLFEKCILKNKINSVTPIITIKQNEESPLENIGNRYNLPIEPIESVLEPNTEPKIEPKIEPNTESNLELNEENPTLEEEQAEESATMPTENTGIVASVAGIAVVTEPFESTNQDDMCEVDFDLDDMDEMDTVTIKKRNEMYYEMYMEARRKAKIARDLALSAYLEARRIKNTYMLDDILDTSDDESDIDELEQMDE